MDHGSWIMDHGSSSSFIVHVDIAAPAPAPALIYRTHDPWCAKKPSGEFDMPSDLLRVRQPQQPAGVDTRALRLPLALPHPCSSISQQPIMDMEKRHRPCRLPKEGRQLIDLASHLHLTVLYPSHPGRSFLLGPLLVANHCDRNLHALPRTRQEHPLPDFTVHQKPHRALHCTPRPPIIPTCHPSPILLLIVITRS